MNGNMRDRIDKLEQTLESDGEPVRVVVIEHVVVDTDEDGREHPVPDAGHKNVVEVHGRGCIVRHRYPSHMTPP